MMAIIESIIEVVAPAGLCAKVEPLYISFPLSPFALTPAVRLPYHGTHQHL
jgi:hypothetical protein